MTETLPAQQSEIATARLRLRRLRPRDAGLIGLYASDPRVARMTAVIPHPYPPGLAESFIERDLTGRGGMLTWGLDAGEDDGNGLIGLISLRPCAEGEAEIGYWVGYAFWGTGYAGEAVESISAWASSNGYVALSAEVFQDNPASIRVLTRAGFAYEGDGEVHSVSRNGMVPTFRYRRPLI